MKQPKNPKKPLILAIDQGTTTSRAIVFTPDGRAVAVAQHGFAQHYPRAGWVEHDPEEIWRATLAACREALDAAGGAAQVAAIGIANQRETTLVWERGSGKPVYNAIVWQDRRTAAHCAQLARAGWGARVTAKTGLLLDAYFSAPKIAWILEHVDGARRRAEAGELAFGTIDSFLLWRLCGRRHVTDASNASRTMLFDIHRQCWDEELLGAFGVPAAMLPQVLDCADDYGAVSRELLGAEIPVCGVAGDQQAALFGQACLSPGMLKCTFGSGAFLMMATARPVRSHNRLLCTLASRIKGRAAYALEGSIFHAGTALQWLREIGVLASDREIDAMVMGDESGGDESRGGDESGGGESGGDEHRGGRGLYLVPAFTGLGAPHWQPHARAAIFGITRGTGKAHLVRAALQAVAFQTRDLLEAMRADSGEEIAAVRVDGGMAVNEYLLQFLADICGARVERPAVTETTALGAARLAGLQCGLFDSPAEAAAQWRVSKVFAPRERAETPALLAGWEDALARVKRAE
ncbi:MAG: glycerol kinase [Gammaproteobacteria bacterium]